MNMGQKTLIVLCGALAFVAPARAQYTNPYTGNTWNNPMSSYMDTVIMGNQQMSNLIIQQSIQRNMLERSQARRRGKAPAKSKARRVTKTAPRAAKPKVVHRVASPADAFQNAVRATSFKFVASPVVPQKLAELLIPTVEDRPKAAKIFGWCLQSAREDMRKNPRANLPSDNVARALAFFLMSSRGLALTRNGEKVGQRVANPTLAQSEALRRQIALGLSQDAGFRAKSDRQKQEMYEMLLIMPAYCETVYGIGLQQNNTEAQELSRSLARDNLKKLIGVKPEQMRFTDDGLQF